MSRFVLGALALVLGLTLVEELAIHLWLAIVVAIAAAYIGRRHTRNNV